ncbi:hypothetical protein [Brevundimonas diminuta]|uniref:hypothetical protein n=1 Tax=Brevundimonas diminuta TaxID=293 RepID=UPI003209BF36
MAVMAVAGVAAAYMALGRPWAAGTIADWVVGSATLLAVVVALRTSREQGRLALQVAEDNREEIRRVALKNDIRFSKTTLFIATNAHSSLKQLIKITEANLVMKGAKKVISTMEVCKATSRGLTHLSSNAAPSTTMLRHLIEIETSYGVAVGSADLNIEHDTEEAKAACLTAMQQLDDACARLAAHCVSIGALPDAMDDWQVVERLKAALRK